MFSKKRSRIPTNFYLFGGCLSLHHPQWVTRNGCLSLPLETQVLPVGGIPAMAWYMGNHRSHGDLAVKMGQIPKKLLLPWRKWWESSGGNGVQDFQTHPLVGNVTFWTFWTTRLRQPHMAVDALAATNWLYQYIITLWGSPNEPLDSYDIGIQNHTIRRPQSFSRNQLYKLCGVSFFNIQFCSERFKKYWLQSGSSSLQVYQLKWWIVHDSWILKTPNSPNSRVAPTLQIGWETGQGLVKGRKMSTSCHITQQKCSFVHLQQIRVSSNIPNPQKRTFTKPWFM